MTAQSHEPNLFDLSGGDIRVHYSTSSIAGQPLLTYQDEQRQLSFSGDEIRRAETEIGAQVSVTLEAVPDLHTLSFTLLLPAVRLREGGAQVEAVGILTTHRSSIGGPQLLEGALQSYSPVTLCGEAQAVLF